MLEQVALILIHKSWRVRLPYEEGSALLQSTDMVLLKRPAFSAAPSEGFSLFERKNAREIKEKRFVNSKKQYALELYRTDGQLLIQSMAQTFSSLLAGLKNIVNFEIIEHIKAPNFRLDETIRCLIFDHSVG